jgi:hypothetical protein
MDSYEEFIKRKNSIYTGEGIDVDDLPGFLYDFQVHLVRWALSIGRAAIFADCGLGKTPMQLVWADCVARHTGKRVLIATPLAVGFQTEQEGVKFGIDAKFVKGGILPESQIVITNYEQLHKYNSSDFAGMVCDESSILKNFEGKIKGQIVDFMNGMKFRLLCTATAAPNDFVELGTSAEALGYMGVQDMINKFFTKNKTALSRREEYRSGMYRFRGHSERDFWRWVCSWSRAVRKPSDIGYSDDLFNLPELKVDQHIVKARTKDPGRLFELPAVGLAEQRKERSRTVNERCEKSAELVNDTGVPAVVWCQLNKEGDLLNKLIPDSEQVSGRDDDESKEDKLIRFSKKDIRVLITKPVIGGFGLNWQHCSHQTYFPSHSFEQWYQGIRRCWRFGQKSAVKVDMISSEGESEILHNMQRKQESADTMFEMLKDNINNELKLQVTENLKGGNLPSWI